MNSLKQKTEGGEENSKEDWAGLVRPLGFLSHGKLSIRINTIYMLKTKAEGRLWFPAQELFHPFCTVLPLPQWDTGITPKCANTKTPPAFCAQKLYLNYTKGQPWQAEQLIPAFQSRVKINIQKWNLHKRTNDKMMPASTIQILINLFMRVSRKGENIICGDKLKKMLAANKMDDEIGNHSFSYYLFFLNSTLYYPLHFSSCFQITF